MICPQVTQLLHQIFPVAISCEVVILVFVAGFFSYIVYQEVVKALRQRQRLPDQNGPLGNAVRYQFEGCTPVAPISVAAQVAAF